MFDARGRCARREERMHRLVNLMTSLVAFFLAPSLLLAQGGVAGDCLLTEDVYGNALHQRLTLKVAGAVLSGTLGRRPIQGTLNGSAIQFTSKNDDETDEFVGTLSTDGMAGTLTH